MGVDFEALIQETKLFFHGSTVATNTIVTRSGAKVGLITTQGFEDTILIMRIKGRWIGQGEEYLKHMVKSDKPEHAVPRPLIKGVREIRLQGRYSYTTKDRDRKTSHCCPK